jgi:hypothetical protein
MKLPRHWLVVSLAILSFCAAFILLFIRFSKNPLAPTLPVVAACKEPAPGMRRIGERSGLQFDVPEKELTFHQGTSDAGPLTHGFDVRPKNSKSLLEISYGPGPSKNMTIDPARTFSAHVEKRIVFNDKGRPIGEDEWGYLASGERWRRVTFGGGDVAAYDLAGEKVAELFDRVINSACLSLHSPQPIQVVFRCWLMEFRGL